MLIIYNNYKRIIKNKCKGGGELRGWLRDIKKSKEIMCLGNGYILCMNNECIYLYVWTMKIH